MYVYMYVCIIIYIQYILVISRYLKIVSEYMSAAIEVAKTITQNDFWISQVSQMYPIVSDSMAVCFNLAIVTITNPSDYLYLIL